MSDLRRITPPPAVRAVLWSILRTCLIPAVMLVVGMFVRNGWVLNGVFSAMSQMMANWPLIWTWLGSILLLAWTDLHHQKKAAAAVAAATSEVVIAPPTTIIMQTPRDPANE